MGQFNLSDYEVTPKQGNGIDLSQYEVKKKASGAGSPHDFSHGYHPSAEDLKQKQNLEQVQQQSEHPQQTTQSIDFTQLHSALTQAKNQRDLRIKQLQTNPNDPYYKQLQQQRADYEKAHPGSWSNAFPQLFHGIVGVATKAAASGAHVTRDIAAKLPGGEASKKELYDQQGSLTDYGKQVDEGKTSDWLGKLAIGLDAYNNETAKNDYENPLPHTFLGQTAQGAIGLAPILATTALFPEAEAGEAGEVSALQKLKSATVNPFTKVSAIQGGLDSYDAARQKGLSPGKALVEAGKGAAKEGGEAVVYNVLGDFGGNVVSPKLAKGLEKTGIFENGKFTKMGADVISDAALFSAYPFASDLIQGKPIDQAIDDAKKGLGIGGLFGGIKALHTAGEFNEGLKDLRQQVAMKNFTDASPDAIKEAYDLKENPNELMAKSVDYAAQAKKETDPNKRDQLVAASSTYGKLANLKTVSQAIVTDKDAFLKGINESTELTPEQKQGLIDKVEQVHKANDPIEKQKTDLESQIRDLNSQIKETSDPIEKLQNEAKQKKLDELNKNYLDLLKQQENEKEKRQVNNGSAIDEVRPEGQDEVNGRQMAERPEDTGQGAQAISDVEKTDEERGGIGDATKEGEIEKSDVGEYPGVPQGEDLRKDEEKIRQEEGEPTSSSSSLREEAGKQVTGIKKVITEATRVRKQLPEVKLSPMMKDHEVLSKGKAQVESGDVNPEEVVNRIINEGGSYHPDKEAPAMQYYGHQLARQEEELSNAIAEAPEEDKPLLISNRQQLDDQIDRFTQANRINSNSWGKLGNIMQIEADQSFSPANIRSIIKENYGGTIPPEVEARLKSLESERDKAISDLKAATEKSIKENGGKMVEKIQRKSLIKKSKEQLKSEAEGLVKDLRSAMKRDFSKLNAGIPIPTETLAVMGKLAVNYFQQGVKDFEGIANKIYDDLKDIGVDKNQVREYLSNYEPLREESKQRRLTLLGRKQRSIEKQLETGEIRDYRRKPEITFKPDNEVIKARQRVIDAEFKLKQEKFKSYKTKQSDLQRGLNRIIRWRRRIVLANPLTSLKLISAALSSPVMRIQKQIVGAGIAKLIPSIAKKASIEGNFNAKTELEYWRDVFDPKKFYQDAKEIYKTGSSPLKKEFGKINEEHYKWLDAIQDTHMVIKAPVHRAAFEATMKQLYDWAANNGIDYTDPLIVKNFENTAIKEADYEIFQEDIQIGKKIRSFLGSDTAGKLFDESKPDDVKRFLIRFMLPINLVPLNIARRIESYTFGTISGSYRAVEAYRKGIENLTPDQANYIMKQLKNGAVGAAYYTIGLFASKAVLGGLWQKDDSSARKSLPTRAAYNEMRANGTNIDKRLQHGMPLFLMQEGATTSRVYNHYMDVPDDDPKFQQILKSTAKAMMATQGSIAEEVPLISTPKELIESLSDPQAREKLGEEGIRMTGAKLPQDVGLVKKPDPIDKKLKTFTDDDGNKINLTGKQFNDRKAKYTELINNPKKIKDWTSDFKDDVWNSDSEKAKRETLVDFMHSRGRSDAYIKEKLSDMKADKLNEYIQKQAVEESGENIRVPAKKPKNKYSIKE